MGVFTAIGDGMVVDILERMGFVARLGTSGQMTEKMIRSILLRNRYFAIWPEGTPDKGYGVMQGFSGIVKVYATLNSQSDIIPFVPVVMQVSKKPWKGKAPKKRKKKGKKRRRRKWRYGSRVPAKVIFHYQKPVFIPRDWLNPPNEGGKTKREIIDAMMMGIARKLGQVELAQNPVLNHRKDNHNRPW